MTDASDAYLRFHGPELAVCRRCLACHLRSHSITCHRYRQTHPCLLSGMKARPPHITAVTFPVVKLVPICTAWWTEAHVYEQLAQDRYLAAPWLGIKPATSGLQVEHITIMLQSHIISQIQNNNQCLFFTWQKHSEYKSKISFSAVMCTEHKSIIINDVGMC